MKALRLILIFLLAALTAVTSACRSPLSPAEEQRLELVKEIRSFEKELGFQETENFKAYSPEIEAYDYYFYTSWAELPYALGDPALKFGTGTRDSVSIDPRMYDVYFYSIPAVAGEKTPITKSLMESPLHRFIQVIFHEDWHEQIHLPLSVEEPSAEIMGYTAAMFFAAERFGQNSGVYQQLSRQFKNRRRESEVYIDYYEQLEAVYRLFHGGNISEPDVRTGKARLLGRMAKDLNEIWGGTPDQLNNAFIAFQMTYLRLFPLMHEILEATGSDWSRTMSILAAMPAQGAEFDDLAEVKNIEKQVVRYLRDTLQTMP